MRVFKILRILVFIVLGLVGVYACIGFLGVPWAVKKYGVPKVSKVLGHPVLLRDMTFDPFAFNLKDLKFRKWMAYPWWASNNYS